MSEVDGPFGVNLTFGYDGGGNRVSVTDNKGGSTTSTFGAAGELSSRVVTAASTSARIDVSYDAAGQESNRTRTQGSTPAGETDTLYDAGGMITSLITANGSARGFSTRRIRTTAPGGCMRNDVRHSDGRLQL